MHSLNVDIRPAFQWVGPTAGLYAADCLLLWQQLFCRCQISPAHRQMEQKPHQPELLKTPASIIVWSKKCRIQIKNCDTHAFSQRLNLLALGGRQADWVEGRERLCHRQIRHACTYNPSAINPAASLSATQPKLIYALVTLKWALPRSHQNIITFYSLLWRHGSQGDRTQYICKHVRTVPVCSLQLLQGFLSFHSFALCLRYNLVLKRHFLLQQPAGYDTRRCASRACKHANSEPTEAGRETVSSSSLCWQGAQLGRNRPRLVLIAYWFRWPHQATLLQWLFLI